MDLHRLPRVTDSSSFMYLDQCRVEQDDMAIAAWDLTGITHIPVANLHCLLLGPGTVITHAAVRAIVDNGCNIVWVGERGVRTYACALGETRSSRNLLRQAALATREKPRLEVVARMYRIRFSDPLPEDATLQQIRGMEGIRVRQAYANAAKLYDIKWGGRQYNRRDWDNSTPINKALSAANACLYGVAHAVIIALGYSPGLGFIHSGKQLSFAYDIADLYKVDYAVPAAFEAAREDSDMTSGRVPTPPKERLSVEQRARYKVRQIIVREKLLERIPRDIAHVLNVPIDEVTADDPWAEDVAAPAPLWEPRQRASRTRLVADSNPQIQPHERRKEP
ncbi:MAG: type I-E CRISPR-associated endonuclease Cas1 [Candidatus Sumerlaeia bacterium]|nr:type I-E CRISPR-associated endonuclease Cas1 [Candidatus Sumerlaeia bacterium]